MPTPSSVVVPATDEDGTWLTTRHGKTGATQPLDHRTDDPTSPSVWFAAFHRAKRMSGNSKQAKNKKGGGVKKFDSYEDMVKALAQRIRAPARKVFRQRSRKKT